MNKSLAEQIVHDAEKARNGRGTWESQWEDIARRILPAYAGIFTARGFRSAGEARTEDMVDATGAIALTRFAATMESMLTPRASIWHNLKPSDDGLMKDRDARLWFESLNKLLFKMRYSPHANFASQQHEVYTSLGAFGTGALLIDEAYGRPGLRYKSTPLAEIFFCENHQGVIDKAYRIFMMTGRQLMQRWEKSLSSDIKSAIIENPDTDFEVYHAVYPNDDIQYGRKDAKGMAYKSVYVIGRDKTMMPEEGYHNFPYAISRYVTAPGEIYGRSPAMLCLPAIKTLNEQKKTVLKQGHRIVDPVLLAYDDGVLDDFSMKPGALNMGGVNADGRLLVHTLPTGNIAVTREMMEEERKIINDAFLVSLFQILVETPEMTATEVMERTREKGALLSPTMGRQMSEALGPMIEREIDILSRQGLLAPMPPALVEAQGEYRIEYDSPLSRAQRSEEAAGALRTVQWAADIAANTQNPATLDWFNFDEMIPELADINAMPQRWLNDIKTVQQAREGRAQAQQTQQMIEAGPTIAALSKQSAGMV